MNYDKDALMQDVMKLATSRPEDSDYRIVFCMTTDADTTLVTTYADGNLSLLALAQFTAEVGRRVTSMLMGGENGMTRGEASELVQSFFETGCHLANAQSDEPHNVAFDNSTGEYPIQ